MKLARVKFLLVSRGTILMALAAILSAGADYSNTVASLNPVGYWRLNEPVSPTLDYALGTAVNYGSLGASANGTYYHSSILQQPGVLRVDPSVKLDGASQYIDVPYSPVLNTNGPFSVEFWANQTAVAAGATVNLDTDVTVGGLTFNNKVANQTIASSGGKTLTLASGGMVTVNAGSHAITANVNCQAIDNAASLFKVGPGALTLSGTANSIAGSLKAEGGTLTVASSKFYFNGGILKPTVSDADVALALDGMTAPKQTLFMQYLTQVVLEHNGANVDTAGQSISIDQSLLPGSGNGGLTKQGSGILTLLQPSTYTGPTKVQGGRLACATDASLAPTALEIAATAKVDLQYSGTRTLPSLTLGGVVKGPGVYGNGTDPTYFAGPGTVTVQPPTPPTPTLPPDSFSIATGGVPTFTDVPTTAGYTYWLTYKNHPPDPIWIRIGAGTAGGGHQTFIDSVTPYPAYRFYRLEVQERTPTLQGPGLRTLLQDAPKVAMQYSPRCPVPGVANVDAGTVELIRSLGVEVVSSAESIQVFEAKWTPAQLEMHLEAGRRESPHLRLAV